ncbi:MAG: hypothetical protein HY465_01020, partial [Deltaproteobacteria bacterium]|nr:hypothetical protein [Deltaproteobacteria bacterium]
AIWEREFVEGRDINGDHFWGNPTDPNAVIERVDEETGEITYIDNASGRPIHNPIRNPNYEPKLFGGTLRVSDVNTETNEIDLELLEPSRDRMYEAEFRQTVFVPEVVWVRRAEGTREAEYNDLGDLIPYLPESYTDDPGSRQPIPEDKSRWMQVKITKVEVISDIDEGTTDDGTELKGHRVVFYATDTEGAPSRVLTLNIRGFDSGDPSYSPGAALMSDGNYYVAPSSLGFRITGDGTRVSPVEVDASGYKSTGRHRYENLSDLAPQLDGAEPAQPGGVAEVIEPDGDDEDDDPERLGITPNDRARHSWDDNLSLYTGDVTYYHRYSRAETEAAAEDEENEGPWDHWWSGTQESRSYSYSEDGVVRYHDSFVSDDMEPGLDSEDDDEGNPYSTYRSGVRIDGLRGILNGSRFNDVIVVPEANQDFSNDEVLSGFLPRHRDQLKSTDPEYQTVIEAGGGNNAIIGGAGNYNISGATFLWLDLDDADTALIQTPDTTATQDGGIDTRRNPWTYLRVRGGQDVYVYNPDETATDDQTDTARYAAQNDFYDIERNAHYANPTDEDLSLQQRGGSTGSWHDTAFYSEDASRARGEITESINRIPDLADQEAVAQEYWNEMGGPAAENEEEMDAFFGEMFGTIEEFGDLEAEAQNDSDDGSGGESW